MAAALNILMRPTTHFSFGSILHLLQICAWHFLLVQCSPATPVQTCFERRCRSLSLSHYCCRERREGGVCECVCSCVHPEVCSITPAARSLPGGLMERSMSPDRLAAVLASPVKASFSISQPKS